MMPGRSRAASCRPKAETGDAAGPIALHKNVGVAQQRRERFARALFAQIERSRQLSASGIDDERKHEGR